MLEWAPGKNAVLEWTQDWIQTLNKNEEDQAPTFTVKSPPPDNRKQLEGCNSPTQSILRNGYQKKRSVSWSKTIQVETFQKVESESRDDISVSVSESESDESEYDNLDISRSGTMDDEAENRDSGVEVHDLPGIQKTDTMGEDATDDRVTQKTDDDKANNRESVVKTTELVTTISDESEDVFAQIEVSFSGNESAPYKISTEQENEDVYELVAAASTITEATMEEGVKMEDAAAKHELEQASPEKVEPSSVFTPVLLPDNFRLENRLERTDSGSFCTLDEDDKSLISNMDDTASLVDRRAASDEESIVSVRRRKVDYADTKQREVDGVLGHLGLVLPLPTMQNFWTALGVNEVGTSRAVSVDRKASNARLDNKEVHRTGSISVADSDDLSTDRYAAPYESTSLEGSEVDSDMATITRGASMDMTALSGDMMTLSREASMSQEELSVVWRNKIENKKKKSRFGRLSFGRRKKVIRLDDADGNIVPSPKKRGLFNRRRRKSKGDTPQLLVC